MRGILITLFFFFGPLILMFALRHAALLLRIWMRWRALNREGADVIDVTPDKPHPPGKRFIAFAVIVALVCAGLVWMRLADTRGPGGRYVPAHIGADGKLIPGHYQQP